MERISEFLLLLECVIGKGRANENEDVNWIMCDVNKSLLCKKIGVGERSLRYTGIDGTWIQWSDKKFPIQRMTVYSEDFPSNSLEFSIFLDVIRPDLGDVRAQIASGSSKFRTIMIVINNINIFKIIDEN